MKSIRELRNEVTKAQEELKAREQELEQGMKEAVLEGRLVEVIESEWRDVVSEERKRCYCVKCGAFAPLAVHSLHCLNCGAVMRNSDYHPQFYRPEPEPKPEDKSLRGGHCPGEFPTPVREIIEILEEVAGMTRAEIADKVGVSAGAVTNWKTGNKRPSIKSYNKLNQLLEETA